MKEMKAVNFVTYDDTTLSRASEVVTSRPTSNGFDLPPAEIEKIVNVLEERLRAIK
jgi:hypothetical protein